MMPTSKIVFTLALCLLLLGGVLSAGYYFYGQSLAQENNAPIQPIDNLVPKLPRQNISAAHILGRLYLSAPYDDLLPTLTDPKDAALKTALAPYAPSGIALPAQLQSLYFKSLYFRWRLYFMDAQNSQADIAPPPDFLLWLHRISGGRIVLTPRLARAPQIETSLEKKRILSALDEAVLAQDFITADQLAAHLIDDAQHPLYRWQQQVQIYLKVKPHIERLIYETENIKGIK